MEYWHSCVQQLRDFTVDREKIIINDLKNYFSLSDGQIEYYFGSLMD